MSMNHIPCPGRIITDLGDAFGTGAVLGSLVYFVKGAYFSVRRERFKGGIQLLASRAPYLGGNFAMWGCIFSTTTCALTYLRNREDIFNSIIAGATTGFVLAIRGGIRNAVRSALIGGLFLAIIEVGMVIYNQRELRKKVMEENQRLDKLKQQKQRLRANIGKKTIASSEDSTTVNRI